jgi:hypothetical protein
LRGKGFARSAYPNTFALYVPCTSPNHVSRFPENFRGCPLIPENYIVLSLQSESKEEIETTEEMEEVGD